MTPPAPNRSTTSPRWDDLGLEPSSRQELERLLAQIRHGDDLMADGGRPSGVRALFHGPPGTGKTLAASLLGQEIGRSVYRVDLSKLIAKYIGETEKNLWENHLDGLFDPARSGDRILLLDEADALFGARTETHTANDRFTSQRVVSLLQRIEEFPGVVLLATHRRPDPDEAFLRRVQFVIHFSVPEPSQS